MVGFDTVIGAMRTCAGVCVQLLWFVVCSVCVLIVNDSKFPQGYVYAAA